MQTGLKVDLKEYNDAATHGQTVKLGKRFPPLRRTVEVVRNRWIRPSYTIGIAAFIVLTLLSTPLHYKPTITNIQPTDSIMNRTPTIAATVMDKDTELTARAFNCS
jgi:hypothetical protein